MNLNKPCDPLVLGTAQLGMPYGVANVAGQPDPATVTSIVSAVWSCGVRFFDTAQAYGTSETALGQAFADLSIGGEARVVTKLKPNLEDSDARAVLRSIEASLERIKIPRLWGILLHHEENLHHWGNSVGKALREAKQARMVSHIGASVYSAERALQALDMDGLELIQVPANVFDRRMERAGVFKRARDLDKGVFVRSIYLQGLALMQPDCVSREISCANNAVAQLRQFCTEHEMDRRHFAIDYVRRMAPSAWLIVGVETIAQAFDNCALFQREPLDESVSHAWTARWPQDFDPLIDPRRWLAKPLQTDLNRLP
jgi:aryl-alcohol dehydrogenase-like predicted oxidoreductase